LRAMEESGRKTAYHLYSERQRSALANPVAQPLCLATLTLLS
jgi:hypothetical protein